MKLAEALAMRSDASKRFEQLRSRAQANARYQEGEPPAEDAAELLAEAGRVLDELEDLMRRINRTNAATALDDQTTITDAIARRDVLRLRARPARRQAVDDTLGLIDHVAADLAHYRIALCGRTACTPQAWFAT